MPSRLFRLYLGSVLLVKGGWGKNTFMSASVSAAESKVGIKLPEERAALLTIQREIAKRLSRSREPSTTIQEAALRVASQSYNMDRGPLERHCRRWSKKDAASFMGFIRSLDRNPELVPPPPAAGAAPEPVKGAASDGGVTQEKDGKEWDW